MFIAVARKCTCIILYTNERITRAREAEKIDKRIYTPTKIAYIGCINAFIELIGYRTLEDFIDFFQKCHSSNSIDSLKEKERRSILKEH